MKGKEANIKGGSATHHHSWESMVTRFNRAKNRYDCATLTENYALFAPFKNGKQLTK